MTGPGPADPYTEHYWREFLTKGDPRERRMRRVFKHIPHGPRCQICAAPFGGIGASLMRAIGKRRSEWNPKMCNTCNDFLAQNHGGAEIEGTFLFADIRGSTALAERIGSASFRDLLDRFYSTASTAVFAHEGMVAVHTVVGADEVWGLLPRLKSAGASGILVLPIEKIVP